MNSTGFSAVIRLAADKLNELGTLRSELDRFIEATDITATEISAVFEHTRLCMERIGQIDRQLSESAGSIRLEPELSQLLDDQRALARKVIGMTRIAYEKAERLSADCRSGLAGVQQKKWILAQFSAHPIEPGSLLDYSEKICTVQKK
jgi:hypothetical protein